MADAPEAPSPAPTEPSVANQPTTNQEPEKAPETKPTEAPDMHGFTQDDLAGMRRFIDNNGGWDAIKAKISTPKSAKPAEPAPEAKPVEQPTEPAPQPAQPVKTPEGAITQAEFMAKQYFTALAGEEKYAPIAKGIASGEYLKEMNEFGIQALNPDGSINDQKVRMYLDLKAQTVPAQPTNTEPNMSTAPTVDYITVGDKIENMEQAQAVFMQKGHPRHADAAEFIKATLAGKDPHAEPKK